MNEKRITRGQALFVTVVFFDENGSILNPSSASLRIAYSKAGVRAVDDIDLTSDGSGNWTAVWDSSVADVGVMFYWATSAGAPAAAVEGRLKIDANPANPQTA